MADVDADALLAQALWAAEQAEAFEHDWGGDRSDDSDYDGARAKKRKRQQQRRGSAKQPRKSAGGRVAAAALQQTADAPPGVGCNSTAGPQPALPNQTFAGISVQSMQQAASISSAVATAGGIAGILQPAAASGAQQQKQQAGQGDSGQEQHEQGPSGRRKRKDHGQKREAGRAWTDEEEAAFLQGLEQHGRDWKAVAEAIGTRDSRQVASHAQKHFVKLCLAGQPLPAKVAESGKGYTLSGRLLDPNSAAAQAYGFKTELLQRLEGEALATAMAGILPSGMSAEDAAQQGRDQVGKPPSTHKRSKSSSSADTCNNSGAAAHPDSSKLGRDAVVPVVAATAAASTETEQLAAALAVPPPLLAPSEKVALTAAAQSKLAGETAGSVSATASGGHNANSTQGHTAQHQQHITQANGPLVLGAYESAEQQPDQAEPSAAAGADGQAASGSIDAAAAAVAAVPAHPEQAGVTEYARSRPRRAVAGQRLQLGATSESLELLACREFVGPVGSGLSSAQPYSVEVDMQAMLVMEVHAHLSSYEVIGLLGGTWDSSSRLMRVTAAYPCSRAAGSDAATSVELAPEAEVEARGAMAAAGQRCVGWYHSHPVFEPTPSLKDCENQRNYQALTRDDGSQSAAAAGLEPFVGFILSPYDLSLPRPHTAISCFLVQQKGPQLVPYNVRYGMVGVSCLPSPAVRSTLRSLLTSLVFDVGRTDFNSAWRGFSALGGAGGLAPLGPPVSKAEKLLAGLRWQCSYVTVKGSVRAWLKQLCEDIQEIWDLPLDILRDKQEQQPEPTPPPQQQETAIQDAELQQEPERC